MAHRGLECGGGFSCQTDDGITVRTVIGDFKINNSIIVANDGIDIIAGLAVFFNDPDSVFDCIGEIIDCKI